MRVNMHSTLLDRVNLILIYFHAVHVCICNLRKLNLKLSLYLMFSLTDNASVSHTKNRRDAHLEKVGYTQDIHLENIDLAFGER